MDAFVAAEGECASGYIQRAFRVVESRFSHPGYTIKALAAQSIRDCAQRPPQNNGYRRPPRICHKKLKLNADLNASCSLSAAPPCPPSMFS